MNTDEKLDTIIDLLRVLVEQTTRQDAALQLRHTPVPASAVLCTCKPEEPCPPDCPICNGPYGSGSLRQLARPV